MSDCFVLYTLMQGIVCKEQYTPMAWQQHHCACCMFPLHLPPPPHHLLLHLPLCSPPSPTTSTAMLLLPVSPPPPVTVAHVAQGLLAQCPLILICVNQVLYLHLADNWDSHQA